MPLEHKPPRPFYSPFTNPAQLSIITALRRPPPHKLLQILHRRDAQDEPPRLIRHNRKLLLPTTRRPVEEALQLLQRRLHCDDAIRPPPPLEPHHRLADLVALPDLPLREELLQARDREVAEQGARVGRDDRQVRVVALEGREERVRDRVRRVAGERGRRVQVFDGGLWGGEGMLARIYRRVARRDRERRVGDGNGTYPSIAICPFGPSWIG